MIVEDSQRILLSCPLKIEKTPMLENILDAVDEQLNGMFYIAAGGHTCERFVHDSSVSPVSHNHRKCRDEIAK